MFKEIYFFLHFKFKIIMTKYLHVLEVALCLSVIFYVEMMHVGKVQVVVIYQVVLISLLQGLYEQAKKHLQSPSL